MTGVIYVEKKSPSANDQIYDVMNKQDSREDLEAVKAGLLLFLADSIHSLF